MRPEIINVPNIFDIDEWFMNNARDKHIELKSLYELAQNNEEKMINITPIDRNFSDYLYYEEKKNNQFINAYDLLKNYCYSGILRFNHESKNILNIETKTRLDTSWDFCLDIEYKTNCWYPLSSNGTINVDPDEGIIDDFNNNYSLSDYPDNTRIGWRGPMVKIADFENIVFRIENNN
jgi:hypothetical protein